MILLYPLPTDTASAWASMPRVPVLSDLQGEELLCAAAHLQLAYDADFLYVHAAGEHVPRVYATAFSTEHPDFWRNDHIDLHLALDGRLVQLLICPDGRISDPQRTGAAAHGSRSERGWQLTAGIPWAALGITPAAGTVFSAFVAHVRWQGRAPLLAGAVRSISASSMLTAMPGFSSWMRGALSAWSKCCSLGRSRGAAIRRGWCCAAVRLPLPGRLVVSFARGAGTRCRARQRNDAGTRSSPPSHCRGS